MSKHEWRAKAKIAIRIGNLELLSCDENLAYNKLQTHLEICEWGEDSRWVIAIFRPRKEGFDLEFVGERPLADTVDWEQFKKVVKLGFRLASTLETR